MSRELIPYKTSRVIKAKHPTDVENEDPLNNTDDGATCTFKVYDPDKDEQLSVTEVTSQTELSVTDAGKFETDDTVEIELDSGAFHSSNVDAVDAAAGTITIASGLPSQASIGKRVRRIFGSAVTMDEYGTPKLDTVDWGFRGTLLSTHVCQIPDQKIDIDITFDGDPGTPGQLVVVEKLCYQFSTACA